MFDLMQYLKRQREFSRHAFGPGQHTAGLIDHIRKELIEVERAPRDLKKWIDVATLALDGAWRAGYSENEICEQLDATLTRNEGRTWPDWRTSDPNKAIEHDRTKDPTFYPRGGAHPYGEG